MQRRAVLVGGPALLAAAAALTLSIGVGEQAASGSVRLPVSEQMKQELIVSAHLWLIREGINVSVGNISIVTGPPTTPSTEGPLAAFVAQDHHFYGSACLTLHGQFPIPTTRPGDLVPLAFSRRPLCVLFSKSSPNTTWSVRYTGSSNCGNIGAVLRGLWGPRIPVCRVQPIIYQL